MEIFLQQEGSFGTILFLGALLAGLLYLILPIFAWRIWYWSRQNSKHLQDLNTKLELLIREIAPDALPAEEPSETEAEAPTEDQELSGEKAAALTDDENSFFAEDDLQSDFSDDDMDFSMADDFDDITDDIANSEISDFTDDETESLKDESEEDDDDELVMDFDEEADEEESEKSDEEPDEAESEDELGAAFTEAPASIPDEIPVAAADSSEFTVEHFESNEESSFEFEDVDDDSFGLPSDTFDEDDFSLGDMPDEKEEISPAAATPATSEPTTESIWGDEPTGNEKPAAAAAPEVNAKDDEFSFGTGTDFGSAFDEPATDQEDGVGETANSFLSDLEDKLNLGSFSQPAPEPPPAPEPVPEPPAAKPVPEPAENQATLFARCEGCGHKLAYKQALSGKRVRCPACRTAFSLP